MRTLSNGSSLKGTAMFTQVSPIFLHYEEQGTLVLNSQNSLQASRHYDYILNINTIDIYFDAKNKTLFQTLIFENYRPFQCKAVHDCHPDTYHSNYNFKMNAGSIAEFTIKHDVKGPRKNYVSLSKYYKVLI